ncbi:MAG: hypothetical protein ABIE55_01860 [Candidatus Aenigmatarchaeota archaeon]
MDFGMDLLRKIHYPCSHSSESDCSLGNECNYKTCPNYDPKKLGLGSSPFLTYREITMIGGLVVKK